MKNETQYLTNGKENKMAKQSSAHNHRVGGKARGGHNSRRRQGHLRSKAKAAGRINPRPAAPRTRKTAWRIESIIVRRAGTRPVSFPRSTSQGRSRPLLSLQDPLRPPKSTQNRLSPGKGAVGWLSGI